MRFPCVSCGACCRSIAGLQQLAEYDRGDGVCRHLTNDNQCRIYDERPGVCRVDESCPPVMNAAEWHRRNLAACERLHLQVYGQPLITKDQTP